ncbi:MAG: hypothetical protein LBU38_00605 [Propionibacteriaceae bacterium]|jgi:hypothetical protein|nr:hypothetical protein [Propionibacteriaceae bacterium]
MLFGFCAGFISLHLRRLELASNLHAGLGKASLCLQGMMEIVCWLALAGIPSVMAAFWAAKLGNSDWLPAFYPAVRAICMSGICAIFGGLLATALTSEKHLFRYFKNR